MSDCSRKLDWMIRDRTKQDAVLAAMRRSGFFDSPARSFHVKGRRRYVQSCGPLTSSLYFRGGEHFADECFRRLGRYKKRFHHKFYPRPRWVPFKASRAKAVLQAASERRQCGSAQAASERAFVQRLNAAAAKHSFSLEAFHSEKRPPGMEQKLRGLPEALKFLLGEASQEVTQKLAVKSKDQECVQSQVTAPAEREVTHAFTVDVGASFDAVLEFPFECFGAKRQHTILANCHRKS